MGLQFRVTEYCHSFLGRFSYKQADNPTANEVWKLPRTAKCSANFPIMLFLEIAQMFQKSRGTTSRCLLLGERHLLLEGRFCASFCGLRLLLKVLPVLSLAEDTYAADICGVE